MQIFAGRKFENPIKIIEAFDNESFIEAFSEIEALRKSHYLLGYIRYEAKEMFLGNRIESKYPLLYFEVYKEAGEFCMQNSPAQINLNSETQVDYKTYSQAINRIKQEIACGNTYQVNYTYDYKIETDVEGFDLYQSILPRQTTPYNTYIKNDYEEILSFSPELFFTLEGNKILTKPMKGTVKRGADEVQDRENIDFLKNDPKNRAENVMIVDLLRNDLGKIAKTGSVKVDKLFEIETHNTVHQMTSEIIAELHENTTLFEIFEALFPCGSVTGTPKINTMKIIDELEVGKREVYCGAIGLISPQKTVFSVPIRILQKKNNQKFLRCRVGGAIVWDSTVKDEWDETLTKIKFLNHPTRHPELVSGSHNHAMPKQVRHDVLLVETVLVNNGKLTYEKEHFDRMRKSAKKLGFKLGKLKIENKKWQNDCILRILLNKEGVFETQILPLDSINTNKVNISKIQTNSREPMLYHKTTFRPWYDEAMEKIKKSKIFDEIFFNEKGELTEGARSNIVLEVHGELITPPVSCGLLNGVLRQEMIKEGEIKEKILYLEDLKNAQKVFCINSVRGIVEVQVDFNR